MRRVRLYHVSYMHVENKYGFDDDWCGLKIGQSSVFRRVVCYWGEGDGGGGGGGG